VKQVLRNLTGIRGVRHFEPAGRRESVAAHFGRKIRQPKPMGPVRRPIGSIKSVTQCSEDFRVLTLPTTEPVLPGTTSVGTQLGQQSHQSRQKVDGNDNVERHFDHIDGLRAFAVLAVLIFHLRPAWLPGGFAGVDVFFVISGFVVTHALERHAAEGPLSFLGGFYARRLARIVPALVVMLVMTSIASTLFIPRMWLSAISEQVATDAFFGISNINLGSGAESYYSPRLGFVPFTHTWSLGVEEQFYLVVPLLLFCGFRLAKRSRVSQKRYRWPALFLVIPSLASISFQAMTQGIRPLTAFYSVRSRFWEMAAGSLLALACLATGSTSIQAPRRARSIARSARSARSMSLIGGAILAASLVGLRETRFPWPTAIAPVIATLLIIAAPLIGGQMWSDRNHEKARSSLLTHRAVIAIGKRSYSLYLWHWPVIVLMRWTIGVESIAKATLATMLSFGLAECSYRLVEQFFRSHPSIRSAPNWKRNAAFLCGLVFASWGTSQLPLVNQRITLSTVARHSNRWFPAAHMTGMESRRRCDVHTDEYDWATVLRPQSCQRHTPEEGRQLFVIGDSHALQYRTAFDQLVAERGITIVIASVPGCSYVSLLEKTPCPHDESEVQQHIVDMAHPGDAVFLASLRSRRLVDVWSDKPDKSTEANAVSFMRSLGAPSKKRELVADAKTWIEPFTSRQVRVVFSLPTPVFRAPAMRCSDWFNSSNGICTNGMSIDRSFFESYRLPVVQMIRTLEQGDGLITSWDPVVSLCSSARCDSYRDGEPLVYDGDHFSTAGNEAVFESLRDAVTIALTD
jgi:peptidoglycan/LPS O-acetylase OafA/YrhL